VISSVHLNLMPFQSYSILAVSSEGTIVAGTPPGTPDTGVLRTGSCGFIRSSMAESQYVCDTGRLLRSPIDRDKSSMVHISSENSNHSCTIFWCRGERLSGSHPTATEAITFSPSLVLLAPGA